MRRLIFGPKRVYVFEWKKGLLIITMETAQESSAAEHVGINVSV